MTPIQYVVTVATAGTPQPLPEPKPPADLQISAMYVKPMWTNTADVYVGLASMNKGTGSGVIKRMGTSDDFALATADASRRIDPTLYAADAEANGQKILVTYWVG